MARSQAQKHMRSRSTSPSSSSATSASGIWGSREIARLERRRDMEDNGETSPGATSPASSFSSKPDVNAVPSTHTVMLSNGEAKANVRLPTPFWPVSLQKERLEELKSNGGDQPPALPEVFPTVPVNITPVEVANPVRHPLIVWKAFSYHICVICRMRVLQTAG